MAQNHLKIIYVSREIERALGTEPSESYHIVSNKTPYGETVEKQHPDSITLVECPPDKLLGTTDLLNRPETSELISDDARLLVFKNTLRVEAAAMAHKWQLLNPPASLSERIENKLSQLRWLGPLAKLYLPSHGAKVAKYIAWRPEGRAGAGKTETPFIVQWAHGHTGDGTMLVRSADDLKAIQEKFPERMARVSAFVDGPSFTVNVVVTPERIMMGNTSYQITGLPPFTDNTFSTIGNDWGAAKAFLSAADSQTIKAITQEIGRKMQVDGWKGLFGIDFIRDRNGRMYLIEVNARQPASTTFESALQEEAREKGARGLTTFEAHLRALLGQPMDQDLIEISDGAQVIQRVTKHVQSVFDDAAKSLEKKGYLIVSYQNTSPNSDLLRIQSATSIMEAHGSFNARGREIAEAIKSSHLNLSI